MAQTEARQALENQWKVEHNAKYDALIEEMGGLARVARLVPTDMNTVRFALHNGDEHLNTIPLRRWDYAAGLTGDGVRSFTMCQPAGAHFPNGLSLAERVCILKRAAVRVANGETAKEVA